MRAAHAQGDNGGAFGADSSPSAAATATGFARAMLGGNAAAAVAHFADDAQFLTPDGTQVGGRRSILALLEQLTASEPELEIRNGRTVVADPVALATQYWTRSSRTTSSELFEANHTARLVLARRERGWQIVIAAPWS